MSRSIVVTIGGATNDERCWSRLRLHTSFCYVLPGHGKRPAAPYTLSETADELIAQVDERFGVTTRIHLFGVAMGSLVAQHVLVNAPHRVLSACLVSTTGDLSSLRSALLARAEEAACSASSPMEPAATLARWFTPGALRRNGPGVRYARSCIEGFSAEATSHLWRAMADHRLTDDLGSLAIPTTIVATTQDRALGTHGATALATAMAAAQLRYLRAPHMAHLERPLVVARVWRQHMVWVGGE